MRRAAVLALVLPFLLPVLSAPAAAADTHAEVVHLLDTDGDGSSALVLRDLETRSTTFVLPDDGSSTDQEPELSPDGSRITLATDRVSEGDDLQIAVVGRSGRGLRALTTPPSATATATIDVSPAWFPDGRQILFSRVTLDVQTGAFVGSDLYVVPADGSGPEQPLLGGEDAFAGDVDPTGTRFAFVVVDERFREGEGRLAVLNSARTRQRELLAANGYDPSWHPSQNLLAFTTPYERDPDPDRGFDGTQVATIAPPPGGSSRTQPLFRTRGGVGAARTFASRAEWSPDGQSLVYARAGFDEEGALPADLWTVDARGGRVGPLVATAADEFDPHWQGPAPSDVVAGTPSGYVPVDPQRVLDTRNGTGRDGVRQKVGPAETVRLQVRGLQTSAGPLPADASAVVLNVTVTQPDASTDVRVFPTGAVPTVSNVNATRGATVPNLVTAAIGADGAVALRNNSGSVHLLADLAGFYRTDGGLGFRAVNPARILDTRSGTGAPAGRVGAGQVRDLRVTGTLPTADGRTVEIPTSAQAVVLNVTATGVSRSTDVRVYPTRAGGAVPEVSNLNLRTGETAANLVTVPVGEGGRVRLRNNSGQTHLLADVAGYYTGSSTAVSRFVPVAPTRFLDTRNGTGAAPLPTGADQRVDLQVGGFRGVPATATAVVANLTATGATASTDVRAFPPADLEEPTVSNLNLRRGTTRANLAVVRLSSEGRFLLRNDSGSVHLLADVAGFFVPVP